MASTTQPELTYVDSELTVIAAVTLAESVRRSARSRGRSRSPTNLRVTGVHSTWASKCSRIIVIMLSTQGGNQLHENNKSPDPKRIRDRIRPVNSSRNISQWKLRNAVFPNMTMKPFQWSWVCSVNDVAIQIAGFAWKNLVNFGSIAILETPHWSNALRTFYIIDACFNCSCVNNYSRSIPN